MWSERRSVSIDTEIFSRKAEEAGSSDFPKRAEAVRTRKGKKKKKGKDYGKKERKLVANNKKAYHDYFIEETYEAGIVLTGTEIKSVRQGKVSIKESYARIKDGEMMLYGMNISPYEQGNRFNADPLRDRKLLLRKQEIRKLIGQTTLKGLTIVPLKMYINEDGLAKVRSDWRAARRITISARILPSGTRSATSTAA